MSTLGLNMSLRVVVSFLTKLDLLEEGISSNKPKENTSHNDDLNYDIFCNITSINKRN